MQETIFGHAPWVNQFGTPSNCNTSPGPGATEGQVLWSVPLPTKFIEYIAVGEKGHCFVVQREQTGLFHLLAIKDGHIVWQTTSEQGIGQPTPLTEDRLLVLEGQTLFIKSQETGSVLKALPLRQWANVYVTIQGHILSDTRQPDSSRQMVMMDLKGEIFWSHPLGEALIFPPLVLEDLIIFGDGPFLQAVNLQGERQWQANQEGFQVVKKGKSFSSTKTRNFNRRTVNTPPIWLGNDKILAGLNWHTGQGFYLFDLTAQTAQHLQPANFPLLVGRKPFAVVLLAQGPCLITEGGQETVSLNLQGEILWKYKAITPPKTIMADATGKVFVSYSPPYDVWEKYKTYYQQEQCFLKCLDAATGDEVFTWISPAPISKQMAAGEGCIYLEAGKRLWAIE